MKLRFQYISTLGVILLTLGLAVGALAPDLVTTSVSQGKTAPIADQPAAQYLVGS